MTEHKRCKSQVCAKAGELLLARQIGRKNELKDIEKFFSTYCAWKKTKETGPSKKPKKQAGNKTATSLKHALEAVVGHSLAPIWARAAGVVMELDDLVGTSVTYDQVLVKLESASLVNELKCSVDETRPWHETISSDLIFDCLCNDPGNLQEVITIIAHFVHMKDNRVFQKTTTNK